MPNVEPLRWRPLQVEFRAQLEPIAGLPWSLARHRIVGSAAPEQLASMLTAGGARVSLYWYKGGHESGQDAVDAAATWLTDLGMNQLRSGTSTTSSEN